MKITFIKDHLEHKAGTTAEVTDKAGNYLIRVKAAKIASKESDRVVKEVKSPVKKVAKK